MAATPVTPTAGLTDTVVTAGTPVIAVGPNQNGGFIINPVAAAGSLFVDPVGAAGVAASGTTFEIRPGQMWSVIPGQTTNTSVNSLTSGHVFSVVMY